MTTPRIALAAAFLLAAASPSWADGNADEGAKVFKSQCGVCHRVDGKNAVGPHLDGVVGRHSGTIEGFHYSAANKGSDITWTEDVLDKYITNPKEIVPGTIMPYAGLKDDAKRADLIAYLKSVSPQ
jgi:cytochrome c